jgi:hypothetical protein
LTVQQRQARSLERRLFFLWPVVELPEDVERVTLLGYWVCLTLGAGNLAFGVLKLRAERATGESLAWYGYLVLAAVPLFFFLGANALRRANWPAAVMLFAFLVTDTLSQRIVQGAFSVLDVLECVLFVVIARGIWLASHRTMPAIEPLTDYAKDGLRDLLVYRKPSTVWPRFQILFWVIGVGEIALFLTPILLHVRN